MRRPQFTVSSLLVAMLVVAAFFAGMVAQREIDRANYAPFLRAPDIYELDPR